MKNKLSDLNNILFEQLERLQDDSLTGDQLTAEINRSKAVTSIASQIIQNGNLVMRATEFAAEYGAETPVAMLTQNGLIECKEDASDTLKKKKIS